MALSSMSAIDIFISYAHRDEALREELGRHLMLLQRQDVIRTWHDRQIGAGTEWQDSISEHLRSADIVLLLISADFLASDYCFDIEAQFALERHETGESRVIPIILRPVDWQSSRIGKLLALPKDGRPVTTFPNHDVAFTEIAAELRRLAETRGLVRHGVAVRQRLVDPIAATVVDGGIDATADVARGFLERLLGPAADEVGVFLHDQVRYYRFRNQVRILAKARQMLADAGLESMVVPLSTLVPLLEAASLEDGDELQRRWAALLSNAASSDSVQPLFGEMLRRLSSAEVRFLDALFANVERQITTVFGGEAALASHVHEVDLGNWLDLIAIYVVEGMKRPDLSGIDWNLEPLARGVARVYCEFGITLDKLLREAILWRRQPGGVPHQSHNHYFMTVVGLEFIRHCRDPAQQRRRGA